MIQATTIGKPLARWLAEPRTSRVIARFDSTLQFESPRRQIWAITTRPNPGAFRAVVSALPDWESGERIGQDLSLSYDSNALWNPRPKRYVLNREERQHAARQLATLIEAWNLPEAHSFWILLADMWQPLANALRAQDSASLPNVITRLIGCGPGLTPAGDDFVQGLLVTLGSGDARDRSAFRALARVVAPWLSRTTRVSRAFLLEALHGWAFGSLKTLLEALLDAPPDAVRALLRVGASSGAACAFGVLMGLAYEFG